MDYSKLSDFEINATIHFGHMPCFKVSANYCSFETLIGEMRGFGNYYYKQNFPDYCNNPADAWLIIVERKINIEWHECKNSEWKPYALNNASTKSCYDNNPLRAAMIVFLMMQDSANVQDNPSR
ncbi:phage protein NinX family protein [Citrobacter freundii]|nr:phage protein NinX family protein [Citrobacter freundii]